MSKHFETDPIPDDNVALVRFFDLSLDLLCIASLEGYLLRINPVFSQVLGYTAADLLSQPFLDLVHPDDQPATLREMQHLRDGLDVIRFRNRYRDVHNHYHDFEWTAKAADGVVYAVARDLSTHLDLEEQVRSSRKREQDILDHTPAVVYVKGVDRRYQLINRQFAQIFHLDEQGTIGATDHDIWPPDVAKQVMANDDLVVQSGKPLTVEEQVPHDDGLHTYISVKFPLFNLLGQVTAVGGISTDVSDRLKAQEAEKAMELARVFQNTLFTHHIPRMAGVDIAGAAVPVAQLCGDYYDFIPLTDQQLAICVGDVAGHGFAAALQMVELRASLRVLLQEKIGLSKTVRDLNNILVADLETIDSFVSFFVAHVDIEQGCIRYIGAGHDAFLLRCDSSMHLKSTGILLGVRQEEPYPEFGPLEWQAGDVLVAFTDGFNEAVNPAGEQFSKARVLETLAQHRDESAARMIEHLFEAVQNHVDREPLRDDMSVIVVKNTG